MPIDRSSHNQRRSNTERYDPVRRTIGERPHVNRVSIGERPNPQRRSVRRRSRNEIWPRFVIGLDLGQAQDPSALVITERLLRDAQVTDAGGHAREFVYHVRHMYLFELGTEYPDIVEEVIRLTNEPALFGQTALIVDATGVGAGIVGLLWQRGLRPVSITITPGHQATPTRRGWNVPKRDLVSVLQVLFQTERIGISPQLELGDDLFEELRNFTARINPRRTQTFSPARNDQHDDLVIAMALGCHYFERLCRRPGIVRVRAFG
jgi:hypothetical protein